MWNTGRKIVETEHLDPKYVEGPNAWKLSFRNYKKDYRYIFSFDSAEVNPQLAKEYQLVSAYEVKYPLNFHINPKVYLWKLRYLK